MDGNKPHIHHETADINIRAVGRFGAGLALLCVVSLGLLWFFFRYLQHEDTKAPVKEINPVEVFPQPRLQQHPVLDLEKIREAEDETLSSYGWVDQQKGVVRIPIDRAIDLLARRGLPARKGAPPVPEASVPRDSGLGVQ